MCADCWWARVHWAKPFFLLFYINYTIYIYMAQLQFIERFRTFCMAIERVRRAFLRQPFHIPLHECSRMKTPPALSPRRRTNNSTYYTYKQRVTQDRTRSFFQKCSFYENVFKILPFTWFIYRLTDIFLFSSSFLSATSSDAHRRADTRAYQLV